MKIRGTAAHVYEKYLQLARDATSAGDRVTAENYLQHAEHYYRILMAQGGQQQQGQQQGQGPQNQQQQPNGGNGHGDGRPMMTPAEAYPMTAGSGPSFSLSDSDEMEEGDEVT